MNGNSPQTRDESLRPVLGRGLLRGSALGLVDQVLTVGATFIANVALARTTSPDHYGRFVLLYSAYTFLSGLHNAAVLEPFTVLGGGRYHGVFPGYLQLALRLHAVIGLVLASVILVVSLVLGAVGSRLFDPMMYGLALGTFFMLTGAMERRVFYVGFSRVSAASLSGVFFVFVCLGLWLAGVEGRLNGTFVFVVLSVSWCVTLPLFLRRYPLTEAHRDFLFSNPDYPAIHWEYCRWVLLTALIFQIMGQGYLWLVGALLSVEDAGLLRGAQNIVLPFNIALSSLSMVVLPRLANVFQYEGGRILRRVVSRIALLVAFSGVLFALLVAAMGKTILHLVYAGKFDAAGGVLVILGLAPLVLGLGNVFNDALKAMGRPEWVFRAYLAGSAATVGLGIPLILHYGLAGAAWGMVLSGLGYATLLLGALMKLSREDHPGGRAS